MGRAGLRGPRRSGMAGLGAQRDTEFDAGDIQRVVVAMVRRQLHSHGTTRKPLKRDRSRTVAVV
jgi:hypothetical protein